MTVYVDDVRHTYGRMVMCHMWADTTEELHAMADKIGVARKWLQQPPHASWTHYDVCVAKKAKAIKLGAVLTDKFGPSEHLAKLAIATGDADKVAHGQKMLEAIGHSRGLRAG